MASHRRGLLAATSVLLGLAVALVAGEIAARLVIAWSGDQGDWQEKLRVMTEQRQVKGFFMAHPELPYVLAPSSMIVTPKYVGSPIHQHNSLGFKGREASLRKTPGIKRIITVGASTTYGIRVKPADTYAGRLEALLLAAGEAVEVINAGVPGWLATDSLLNLRLRVLPLEPDLIIVYQGRNELFPQAYNDFSPDYSHFREAKADCGFEVTNAYHKKLFTVSRLAMLLSTWGGDRFGWSSRKEDPVYACTRYTNQPDDAELIRNLANPATSSTYRKTLQQMIAASRKSGVRIMFATMAFRAEKFRTGFMDVQPRDRPGNQHDPAIYDALQAQIEENNQILREVASAHDVVVAETAVLADEPLLFIDDCHMEEEGHDRRARVLFETIVSQGALDADRP